MSRPAGQLPRVILFGGVEVYAPWCNQCGSDDRTRWARLPPLKALTGGATLYGDYETMCERCKAPDFATHSEAFAAREPERLAARLAELMVDAYARGMQSAGGA